ncbi:MAG TPA: hypothetical protein GX017_07915 [Clostridiales bacterium]|jgi:hypothetical protein|nr:hypothetical protein [Clostridiales bacterium]
MYRIWGILRKNNKIMMDTVAVCEDAGCSDEARLQECIQKICYEFDVQRPMWLPKNEREFDRHKRAVLNQDNFIETISFDTLELELLDDSN